MTAVYADAGGNGVDDGGFDGSASCQTFYALENQWMVTDNEVAAQGDSLVDHLGSDIDAHQHAGAVGKARTHLQPRVVPRFLPQRRCHGFDSGDNFTCQHKIKI